MFSPSPIQLLIVAGIALLLFGDRLPQVMRSLGRSVVEFKKGVKGIDEEVDKASQKSVEKKSDEE
ncbi:MAG: twin-arginine translocase TatA/TatE family subunit [Planctomycetia bacterium]|nr:twin-arginine translocase TatA/TatE family subunit [Planctomycetia bacterium]